MKIKKPTASEETRSKVASKLDLMGSSRDEDALWLARGADQVVKECGLSWYEVLFTDKSDYDIKLDTIKLDTWYKLTYLLEHYRKVTFDREYLAGRSLFPSKPQKELLQRKLDYIIEKHNELLEIWKKELGPNAMLDLDPTNYD